MSLSQELYFDDRRNLNTDFKLIERDSPVVQMEYI